MGADASVHRWIVRLHACMLTIATGSDEKASIAMALGLDRKDTARAGAAVAYENVLIAKELSLFICLVFLTQVRDAVARGASQMWSEVRSLHRLWVCMLS